MTPKLTKAVKAVEKLPQARQDALAELLLEAAARATIDDAIAAGEASFAEHGGRPPAEVFEEQLQRLDALREALLEGEASGPAEPFDFDAFLAEKRATSA